MSDLPYGPFGFPNVRAWGMAPPINVQDDLEAAATPMAVEPTVRPKRRKAADAGTAAFQAVLEDVGGDYNTAISVFANDLVKTGMSPERAQQAAMARAKQHADISRDPNIFFEEMGTPLPTQLASRGAKPTPAGYDSYAAGMSEADTGMTTAERVASVDDTAARWERQKAAYDRATGLETGGSGLPDSDGYYDWSGWQPGMPLPKPGARGMRAGDSEPSEPAGYTLPGPRTLDGRQVRKPQPLQTAEQAEAYKVRGVDPGTGQRTKSRYDLDMEARGYTAVVLDDGTVGYYTTYAPATDEPTGRGAVGRAGDRPDLRKSIVPGTEAPRYEPREMLTPTGARVQVWAPTEAAREHQASQRNAAMRGRLADRAGLGAEEAEGLSDDELRERVRASRMQDKQARADTWKAQYMLSGGRPTRGPGGTIAQVNAFRLLTPEQQQDVVATRMKFGQRDGGKGDEWDRRLDMMRIQMENDRAEREKDRTMTREERQAAREAEERRFAEERDRREQEWKERSAQFDRDNALRRDTLAQEAEVARQRHEQGMVGLQGQLSQIQSQGNATAEQLAMARQKLEDDARIRDEALRRADLEKRRAEAVALYGPGAANILSNDFDTPAAQEAFRNMAAEADETWNGFFTEDAQRLDAILVSLGITDPARRRQLVQEYGINSDFPGQQGRGSVLSAWRVRHPEYLPVE